jgi:DNA-binding CsgD family transcriptional regulator
VLDAAQLDGYVADRVAITIRSATAEEVLGILGRAYALSRRELEIAGLVVDGLTTRQIADRVCITGYTVKDHLKSIFRKVGTDTRGELVATLTGASRLVGEEGFGG